MKKCKSCQSEIDNKAKKCPHCQTDQRGWPARHPIITGIIVLVILVTVIGMASSSGSKSNGNSGSANSAASGNSSSQVETATVGQTVTDGDLAFTVQSIRSATTLRTSSFEEKTAQGIYYILTVQIKNNGKDTKTINASDFKVTDSKGRNYDYSNDGQTAMEITNGGATSFFLQQIQPSLSVTGKIVFDVPKDATGLKLLAQGDIFSQGVSIDLGK